MLLLAWLASADIIACPSEAFAKCPIVYMLASG